MGDIVGGGDGGSNGVVGVPGAGTTDGEAVGVGELRLVRDVLEGTYVGVCVGVLAAVWARVFVGTAVDVSGKVKLGVAEGVFVDVG